MSDIGCEVRMTEHAGEGVFATRRFKIDDTVLVRPIERRLDANTSHAFQVGMTEFVLLGGLGPKVNHSCDPNCGVRLTADTCDLVARQTILPGEEITLDYAMNNYSIEYFPGSCQCGSAICRGSVSGWKDLPDDRKRAYEGFVAPYLLEADRTIGV
jgi:uncharacterized protein